jgi:hypothetical protein
MYESTPWFLYALLGLGAALLLGGLWFLFQTRRQSAVRPGHRRLPAGPGTQPQTVGETDRSS